MKNRGRKLLGRSKGIKYRTDTCGVHLTQSGWVLTGSCALYVLTEILVRNK